MAAIFNTVGEFVTIRGIKLNITLRDAPGCEFMADKDDVLSVIKPMSLVVYHTVVAWFAVKKALETNDTKALAELKTPEASAEFEPTNTDPDKGTLHDPMCTVWGKFKGASITILSSQPPINAYRVAKAWRAAVVMLEEATNGNGNSATENQPELEKKSNPFMDTKPDEEKPEPKKDTEPVSAKGLPDGVIWANKNINYQDYNELQYEPNQGVAYRVNEIELTLTQNNPRPCIKLTTLQGKHTIMCRDKSDKRTPDFSRLVEGDGAFIADKYEEYKQHGDRFIRKGNWVVIMKIAHVEKNNMVKEYKNVSKLVDADSQSDGNGHPF